MPIATVNPATGETLKTFEPLSAKELDERLTRSTEAFVSYRGTTFAQRAGWLRSAAAILNEDGDGLAATMTTEMGKPLVQARAEVEKSAKGCRFYAEHAKAFLADRPHDAAAVGASKAYVTYQPLGPVLAIMPWNFPLWQAMRFAAPALMAGNVGLLKHASNVPQTALYMEELFRRAGFPEGVFQTLLIGSDRVEAVIRDRRVKAVTITGSAAAGRSVAATAGDVIKHSVLELGGSDPFVVMPSGDLEQAVAVGVKARCQNNGQSCIAAKRFIVHRDVADEYERRFVEAMQALRVGDPTDESTDIGPLYSEHGREDLEALVADAVEKGASVLCGGKRPDGPGAFYPPTVLTDVTPEMRIHREEAFGPVAVLYRVDGIDEAIELANATDFGLGANAWTGDLEEQERFVRDLEAGMVFVNGMVASYPDLPFGGVKDSGTGRELSAEGIREFCNVKTVWILD